VRKAYVFDTLVKRLGRVLGERNSAHQESTASDVRLLTISATAIAD
jgi:hypothetical protein